MKIKSITTIIIIMFLISIATVTIPVEAEPGTIVLDGVISTGEWDEATSFSLVGTGTYTAYITNDNQFMYVAFDYAVTTGSDFAAFNTYKEGAFVPETITAPCVTSWLPAWDTIVDENSDDVPETWHREQPTARYEWAVDTATEMKVPLVQLGLTPGDTIKLMFVLNTAAEGAHLYPASANAFDLTTYETYTLWSPPSEVWVDDDADPDWYLDPTHFETINEGIVAVALEGTVNVYEGTYEEDITVDKSLTLNGAQAGVDARGRSASESTILGVVQVTSAATDVVFDGFKFVSPTRAFTPRGFNLHIESESSTIKNNIFVAEENAGHTYSGYLDLSGITDTHIRKNYFSGHLDTTQEPNVILLGISGEGVVTVDKNEMHDVGGGGGIGVMCTNPDAEINILGNEIDNTGDGIWVWSPSSQFDTLTITFNNIHDCAKKGVKAVGAVDGTIIINYNNICDNTEEGVYNGVTDFIIDATLNWWGDASGPYHPTSWMYDATTVGPNPGLGDEVSDYVLYEPWLVAPFEVYTTLEDLADEIDNLADGDFKGPASKRKMALLMKIECVIMQIDQGEYAEAAEKLDIDIKEKLDCDGEGDWLVLDPGSQEVIDLLNKIDLVIAILGTLL